MKDEALELSAFDWHRDVITPQTLVNAGYRNTQNVRRFMREACGPAFRFDRSFMAWMSDGTPKTMGDAAAEWLKQNA